MIVTVVDNCKHSDRRGQLMAISLVKLLIPPQILMSIVYKESN